MCIPGLCGDATAGTDPARLERHQPGQCHPPALGTTALAPPFIPRIKPWGWKGTLWGSAFLRGAPSSPGAAQGPPRSRRAPRRR